MVKNKMKSYASAIADFDKAIGLNKNLYQTFYLRAQASQRVNGEHPPVGIERNHVREHTAKGKGLWRFAQRIDKRVVPSTSIAHIRQYFMELFIRSVEACEHGRRSSIRRRSIVHRGHAAARKRRGPGFIGLHHPVQNLA